MTLRDLVRHPRACALASFAVLTGASCLAGCAPTSRVSLIGPPRVARAPDCEILVAAPADVAPGGRFADQYEPVGSVHVQGSYGAAATDTSVKAELRARACTVGGEVVVPVASWGIEGRYGNHVAQELSFTVYRGRRGVNRGLSEWTWRPGASNVKPPRETTAD